MRIGLCSLLFLLSFQVFCQKNNIWQVEYKLYSGLAIHPNEYLRADYTSEKVSVGFGGGIELKRNFSKRFFFNSGFNITNQTFNATAVFKQSAIPPPRQEFSRVLIYADRTVHQNLGFLIKPGMYIFNRKKYQQSIYVGYAQNVLLSAFYDTGWDKFTGYYKKMTRNGFSCFAGMQHSFKLNTNFSATVGFDVSFLNSVEPDSYLSTHSAYNARLKHNYYQLYIGMIQNL